MNDVNRQVNQAKKRLNFNRFIGVFAWSLFAGLLVAAIGLAIPKIWHLAFLDSQNAQDFWMAGWLIGGGVLALIIAAALTIRKMSRIEDAAIEVDRRFALRERLSSALTIDSDEANSEAGEALLKDAQRSAEVIDVRDQFKLERSWRFALPLIPLALIFAISFFPNAIFEKPVAAAETENNVEVVKRAIKEMEKKIEKKRKTFESKGLQEALGKLKTLGRELDKKGLKDDSDKKQALVELNDIKRDLEKRQKQLGGGKDLKRSLKKLKDVGNGEAKKVAEAMSKGDMKAAAKAVKDIAEKLKSGKMSDSQKKKLAKDIKDLAKEFEKFKQQHENKKQNLEKAIQKAMKDGDANKAAKLQKQMDDLKQQDRQMDKMEKMAKKLQKCQQCMKKGGQGGKKKPGQAGEPKAGNEGGQKQQQQQEMEDAAQALEDLAKEMEGMDEELEEMEALEDIGKAIGECKKCMGKGDKPGNKDFAKGKGPGGGKRARDEEKTGNYKSRVKGKLQKGETVVVGEADGANITGRSVSEVRDIMRKSLKDQADPMENVVLPKNQRDHAREYFQKVRGE